MKIYEHIIEARLSKYLEESNFLSSMQAAYRKGRATVDNILIIQEVFYHYRYKKGAKRNAGSKHPLYLAFMDLIKAFDTVPRQRLFRKLRQAGVKGKMYRVIKDLYTDNKASIRIGEDVSKSFLVNSGVMQVVSQALYSSTYV